MSLNIFLLVNNCSFKKLTTSPSEKIGTLKNIVQKEFNLHQVIKLKYKGKVLNSSKSLYDYQITDCSVIHVVKSRRLKIINGRHRIFKRVVLITKVLLKFNPNSFENIMAAIDNVDPSISDLICGKENYFIKMITKPLNKQELRKIFRKQSFFLTKRNSQKKFPFNSQQEKINPFNFQSNNNKIDIPDNQNNFNNFNNELFTPIFEEFISKIHDMGEGNNNNNNNSNNNNNNNQNNFPDVNFLMNQEENNCLVSNDIIDDFFKRNQVGIESLFNFNNKINERKSGENNYNNYFDFANN